MKIVSYHEIDRGFSKPLPESWVTFINFCATLGHGEIASVKIQDGVPVCAEIVKEKVRFT